MHVLVAYSHRQTRHIFQDMLVVVIRFENNFRTKALFTYDVSNVDLYVRPLDFFFLFD